MIDEIVITAVALAFIIASVIVVIGYKSTGGMGPQ